MIFIKSRDEKQKITNLIILFDFACFTGDYILTGFGHDQAVNRCDWGFRHK
jgi:hypothetical protein